jgi:hypothetical protein
MTQPYTSQVEYTTTGGGSGGTATMVVATRERPKLWFDSKGKMTHLVNGVCSAPSCTDSPKTGCMDCKYSHWDYTLIQPLAV